ncbi:MAG: hypothetical protein HQL27_07275 [Candidatus Omnitrophica bacterium]|nr:hypothetical protein [Candidatus Omnitrophota bacterium]
MLKKLPSFLLLLAVSGCTTITIPKYIKDEAPYSRKFMADFATVQKASVSTLEEMGFKIEDTADPMLYERGQQYAGSPGRQILIFTEIKQIPFFLGTKYTRVNVYLRDIDQATTEVEFRYMTINQLPLKHFYGYKKKGFADKFFKLVAKKLG